MANKKADKNTDISNAQKLGIGVGLTTAAVAAVGAYFLYGSKDAPKNRKKVRSWALKAKGEVLEVLEKAEQITEGEFHEAVNKVVKSYAAVEKLSKNELAEFKSEMTDNWKNMLKNGVVKAIKNQASAPAKTAAKKAVKKAPAKKAATKSAAAKAPAKKAVAKAPAKKAAKKSA